MFNTTEVLDVVGSLYDASTDFSKWSVFLEKFANLFNASMAHLVHHDFVEDRLALNIVHGCTHMPIERFDAYARLNLELANEDPRMVYGRQYPGKPLFCRQVVDTKTLHASRAYKEVLDPVNIEYTLAFQISDDPSVFSGLAVFRGKESESFTQQDAEIMGQFIPHFKRALSMQKVLALIDFQSNACKEALDVLPFGLVLAKENGEILHWNSAARSISSDMNGLLQNGGRLSSLRPDQTRILLEKVRLSVEASKNGLQLAPTALLLDRVSDGAPYQVLVSSLWGDYLKFGLGQLNEPVAVVVISDPEVSIEPEVELLQRLFGFTPKEAQVVQALVATCDMTETAEILKVSRETARSHLKAIFNKTGVSSQAQLIKVVCAAPGWLAAQKRPLSVKFTP